MGTRSLTVFEEGDGTEIAVLYRQMDGYPTGHGAELRAFLAGKVIRNGFMYGDTLETAFNGAGCLAAATVGHLKTGIGGTYLYPAGTRNCGEEYVYTIRATEGEPVNLTVTGYGDLLYQGPVDDFDPEKAEAARSE